MRIRVVRPDGNIMSLEKGKRLGRGLEALIPSAQRRDVDEAAGELRRIRLDQIRANRYQPRHQFNEQELQELEASIRSSGLLQPIAVRRQGGGFELISGERRLRAVTRLGWTEVPAIVKDIDDRTMLTLAMIENLQRADLNPVEEAAGYRALIDDFGLTQQQVADAIGKDRTTVAGLLRILNLPASVLARVKAGELTAGHARALLALATEADILSLSNATLTEHLSVRELERRVREAGDSKRTDGGPPQTTNSAKRGSVNDATTSTAAVRAIEDELRRHLQTDVKIRVVGEAKGHLEVAFYSPDDLDRLLDLILGAKRSVL
jgi:ParB family chromosome partitioning protein